MKIVPAEFEGQSIRRVYDETTDSRWFSVVDVVQVLTLQADFRIAANTGIGSSAGWKRAAAR